MKPLSSSIRHKLIWTAYLLPFACALILIVWALIPHMFFIYGGDVKETVSLFELMGNTWKQCTDTLSGDAKNSTTAIYFSYIMIAAVVISWLSFALYLLASAIGAVCACMAFSKDPLDPAANRVKRWMKFFCFNRVVFSAVNLLPVLPFLMPQLLILLYRKWFAYDMSLHYFAIPSWIVALLLAVLSFALFVSTLRLQREEHLDLFRLYKSK